MKTHTPTPQQDRKPFELPKLVDHGNLSSITGDFDIPGGPVSGVWLQPS